MGEEKTGWEKLWEERVGAFATAVGKPENEVTEALKGLIGDKNEAALGILASEEYSPVEDLKAALVDGLKIPLGVFRANLALLRGPKPKVEEQPQGASATIINLLPVLPDEENFSQALRVGGELKVDDTNVIAAIRATLAQRLGLYDIPAKLASAMEAHAEEMEDPCGELYYSMLNMLAERDYAAVLSALGIKGHFMTEAKKKALMKRMEGLWDKFYSFQQAIKGWQDQWMTGAANPAAMNMMFLAMASGGKMPPGMMAPPDTSALRDSAEGVINAINKAFAGPGIPVARALAYEALRIKKVLSDDRLPPMVGAANREHMLKRLNTAVTADYVRLEENISRYVLAIMRLSKVPVGDNEYAYLTALLQLGMAIPWDKLLGTSGSEEDPKPGKRY